MYLLSLLIVELETARATLLDVFQVSNGTNGCGQEMKDVFSQIDEYEKEIAD